MKTTRIAKALITLAALAAFSAGAPAASAQQAIVLGVVSNSVGETFVINNSTTVRMTDQTKMYNSQEKEMSRKAPIDNSWVYVEGVYVGTSVDAAKIYYLPSYVGKGHKEMDYTFIQPTTTPEPVSTVIKPR